MSVKQKVLQFASPAGIKPFEGNPSTEFILSEQGEPNGLEDDGLVASAVIFGPAP